MTGSIVLHNIILILQVAEIAMNLCALFFLMIRRNEFQQRLLIFMAFGMVVYNLALLGEIMPFTSFELIYYCKCIETLAVAMFQIPFLLFCAQYIGKTIHPKWLRVVMIFYGLITIVQFADLGKGLYYRDVQYIDDEVFPHIEVQLGFFGILFWVFMVFGPVIVELALLIYGRLHEKDAHKKKTETEFILQVSGSVIAFFISIPLIRATGYNPFMLVAGYALCAKIFLSWRKQGLDVIAIAAKSAIDSLSQALIILDNDNRIIYYNYHARDIVNVVDRFVGRNIDEFINYAKDNGFVTGEHEFVKDDKVFISEWNDIIDADKEKVGQTIIFVDVTEERHAVEEVIKQKAVADEANEAKSAFIANMSHEIRTPMNAIIGMSELIIEESRGRKVYNMALQIKKAARNLLSIINNILDYSKMEANKMELVEDEYDLEEMIEDTFNLISIPALERGLSINLYLDNNLPSVLYGDDGKIRQILINLLNNAIKFTKKGHIDLTVNGSVSGDYVQLIFSVEDTGSGITEENQKAIFESFAQVDKVNNKSVEGTGLGLSITKGLVDMMGGKIALSSTYGEGSTFSVSLKQKIVDRRSIKEYSKENDIEEVERRLFVSPATKVLVCDDNKINLLVMEGMLDLYELNLTLVSSGKEAIDEVMKEDFDIIMMDHMMPEMDGIETTGYIRTICASKPKKPHIIALTANSYDGAKGMFLSRGFDDFLAKPVDKLLLYDKLLAVIPESKRRFSEEEIQPIPYSEDDLADLFMKDVDVKKAMDRREGSIKDYLNVLELYYLESKDTINEIKTSYEEKDFANYEIYVHGLKSTSLSIGADGLSDMAKAHEYAAKDNNIRFIDENYDKLLKEYGKILDEIKEVLLKKGITGEINDEEKLDGMTMKELIYRLRRILQLSEDFRSKEAYNDLNQLLKYKLDEDVESDIEDILVKFKMYDDDAAEEKLRTLLEKIEEA